MPALLAASGASGIWVIAATLTGFLGMSLREVVRPLHVQVMTQAKAAAYYLWLIASPTHLSVIHPFRVAS